MNTNVVVVDGVGVGLGAVFRNNEGQLLAYAYKRVVGAWGANVVEAAAIKVGVEAARVMGFDKLWMETDALDIVQKLVKNAKDFSPLFLFPKDIYKLSLSFDYITCSHVKRVGNTVAHAIAHLFPNDVGVHIICNLEHVPPSILDLVAQ